MICGVKIVEQFSGALFSLISESFLLIIDKERGNPYAVGYEQRDFGLCPQKRGMGMEWWNNGILDMRTFFWLFRPTISLLPYSISPFFQKEGQSVLNQCLILFLQVTM